MPRTPAVCLLLICGTAKAAGSTTFDIGGLVQIVLFLGGTIVLWIAYAAARWKGVLVALFIGGVTVGTLIHQRDSLNDWRDGAQQACWADYKALPKSIEAASVVDETAGFVHTELIQLLSERSLDFVEVRVAEEPVKAKAIFYKNYDSGWVNADWARKPYVRLRLGKTSDPTCRPELRVWIASFTAAGYLPSCGRD